MAALANEGQRASPSASTSAGNDDAIDQPKSTGANVRCAASTPAAKDSLKSGGSRSSYIDLVRRARGYRDDDEHPTPRTENGVGGSHSACRTLHVKRC